MLPEMLRNDPQATRLAWPSSWEDVSLVALRPRLSHGFALISRLFEFPFKSGWR